jgi:NADH:ubiquinone reductase (non-electrogenic)
MTDSKEKVVIIGSGWAGYRLAHGIDHRKYSITILSPETSFAVTPLLASAACGLFDCRLAHEPIRRKDLHAKYIKASVTDIDFANKTLTCQPAFESLKDEQFQLSYDKVIVAPGCQSNTFGIPGVGENAIFVKNVADANTVRSRLNDNLEMASLPGTSEDRQRQLLHIIIVGGGPTGIEMAAELTDLFEGDLGTLYPHLKDKTTVAVHDVAPQILSPFDRKLSEYATNALKHNKVEIKLNSHITNVTADTMETKEDGIIRYGMLIWATGNKARPLVEKLNVRKTDHGLKRILTDDYLNVLATDGSPIVNAYALGDAADIDGGTLPTTAEVAIQKADYLVKLLNSEAKAPQPFKYQQRALVTYTGRWDGVIQGNHEYTGYGAWLSWRSGNFFWTRSWRRKILMCYAWLMDWLDGREIIRN